MTDQRFEQSRDAGDYVPMPTIGQQWLLMFLVVLTPLTIATVLWALLLK